MQQDFILNCMANSAAKQYAADSGVKYHQSGIDNKVLIVLAVILVAAVIAAAVVLILKKVKQKKDAPETEPAKEKKKTEEAAEQNFSCILAEDESEAADVEAQDNAE